MTSSMPLSSLPLHYRDDLKSVLIPYGLVQDRIEALASRIFSDLHIEIPEQLSNDHEMLRFTGRQRFRFA